jgi:glyoxylase I family protein
VFSAVDADSKLRGPLEKRWMLNLRDDDLDGMVETLRAAGIAVEPHPEPYPNGRFADLADPEGDRIQLWEPNAASLARDPGRQR